MKAKTKSIMTLEEFKVSIQPTLTAIGVAKRAQPLLNQQPGNLSREIAAATQAGLKAVKYGEREFESIFTSPDGFIYVITESMELVIGKNNPVLKHSVLSGGKSVLSAGTAHGQMINGQKILFFLDTESGHYMQGVSAALQAQAKKLARDVFQKLGFIER